jgi:hypothetical protein
MPSYQKGDVRIHYGETGSGFPLLVTPGGGRPDAGNLQGLAQLALA